MSELNQHKISRLQGIINLIPTTFVQESAGTASCHGTVFYRNFIQIELIGNYRTFLFTTGACHSILLNGLQIIGQFQSLISTYSIRSRFRIDFSTESTCVYTVDVEHIFHLILTELLEFAGTDIIQINKRNLLFFGYLLCPQSESLVDTCDDGAVFIFPSIAGSKRE